MRRGRAGFLGLSESFAYVVGVVCVQKLIRHDVEMVGHVDHLCNVMMVVWVTWVAAWAAAWVAPQYGGLHRGCGRGCGGHSAIRLQCCEQEELVRTLLPWSPLDGPAFPKQSRPVGASETSPLLGVGVVIMVVSYWYVLYSPSTRRHDIIVWLLYPKLPENRHRLYARS